jgi:hypothetical protein
MQLVLCISIYLGFTYVVLCVVYIVMYIHYIVYVTLCILIIDMGSKCMSMQTCSNNTRKIFNIR